MYVCVSGLVEKSTRRAERQPTVVFITAYSGATINIVFRPTCDFKYLWLAVLYPTAYAAMRTTSMDTGNSSAFDARSNAADPTCYS